jgi:hypothetical protein
MRWLRGNGERLLGRAFAALLVAIAQFTGVRADGTGQADVAPGATRFEVWTGAQAYRHVWSLYSGTSVAPFGSIQDDGFRLRLVGGYGSDTYSGGAGVKFTGATSFVDALAGYQRQLGPLTLKVFAGLMATDRQVSPYDPAAVQGLGVGGKVVAEGWLNLGDRAWTAVDASWGSLHQSYDGRARLGWRLVPALSTGLEAGVHKDVDSGIVRAAMFLRYELPSGEISISGGLANDRLLEERKTFSAAHAGHPFAMVNLLTRF